MQGYNRKAIKRLSMRNLLKHKKRSLFITAIIAVFTMLIISLSILCESTYKSLEYACFQKYGYSSHVRLEGITEQEEKRIESYPEIKECGKSIRIGNAVNKEFNGRPTQLRYGEPNFAKDTLSFPSEGRMPLSEKEVALDISVLSDLGMDIGLGEKIQLKWIGQNGTEENREFVISGIFEENELYSNRNIWVTESMAGGAETNIDMTIQFKTNRDIEASYEKMKAKTALKDESVNISRVYAPETKIKLHMETMAYRICAVFLLICGFLVLYNIIQVSITTNIRFYGRMISIGASPGQVRSSILWQIRLLAFTGVTAGSILGYIVGINISKTILMDHGGEVILSVKAAEFAVTALIIYILVMVSGLIPAVKASKVNPSELLNEDNIYSFHKSNSQKIQGMPALVQMSFSYLARFKRRNLITILLLSAGLSGLSIVYVLNNSFSIEKYMDEVAISDFVISEKTLMNGWGNYDTKGNTLSDSVVRLAEGMEGFQEKGTVYSQDVPLKVSDTAYGNIIEYYEQNNGEIINYMGENSLWGEGYRKFKNSHECTASVFGIDGIVSDAIFKGRVLEGKLDKEKFTIGNYAIANGFEGSSSENKKQPTYNVGETVNINGKDFEIMAILDIPYPVTEGKESDDAAFNLSFFIPGHQFKELYPENTIRRLFFNIDSIHRVEAERFAENNFVKNGIPTVSQKSLKESYGRETEAAGMISNMIVYMTTVIGIINLLSTLVTNVHVRKKEFAMMQGIGMTKKQLRLLLAFEGINVIGLTLILSYLVSITAICVGVKSYLSTQWTAAYHFTMTPLILLTPLLILISVIVPLFYLKSTQKEEIMDRLYGDIELGSSI